MQVDEPIVVLPARGNEPAVVIQPTVSDNGADYERTALFILGVAQVAIVLVLSFVLVKQQATSNKNRATIEALCATTAAIRNLDTFFLGLIPKQPPAGETDRERKIRRDFTRLVKADVRRMAAAGDTCKRL